MIGYLRQFGTALRFLLLATLVLGLAYPLVVFGIGQAVVPSQANGSIASVDGQAAASRLIVQDPTAVEPLSPSAQGANGELKYFVPRLSAVKGDPASSSATNLGPNDPKLKENMATARAVVAEREGVDPAGVPLDAVTASGSGLDPSISPEYAAMQAERVARATEMTVGRVKDLISEHTTGGLEAFMGQPSVNVTTLNLAVSQATVSGAGK